LTDVPRYIGRPGSGVFPPLPLPDARSSAGKSSPRLWLPFRVSPLQHRKPLALSPDQGPNDSNRLRLPRFRPLQRFPDRGEPPTPARSQLTGYVAPSGFLTLPTLCSPHGLPGLFHPGPAHGVYPSGPCSPRQCRTSSLTPQPSWSWLGRRGARLPLQGLAHRQGSLPETWGLARTLRRMPPWASPPPGFLASHGGHSVSRAPVPSRAFPARPHADLTVGAPGYLPRADAAGLSRDRHNPLGV
jgi:hypothetical protein